MISSFVQKSKRSPSAEGSRVHYLIGRSRKDGRGHLSTGRLQQLVPDVRDRDVYLCGPEPMMIAARKSLVRAGVPRRHIHHESFVF